MNDNRHWYLIETRIADRWASYCTFEPDELAEAQTRLLAVNAMVPRHYQEVRLLKVTQTRELIA
jgi:tRNA isopentenyl-2-thiomethyl-A-37 hydroxylase MiaE